MTRQKKPHPMAMWCEHCKADIAPAGVRACLRADCKSKPKLKERERYAMYEQRAIAAQAALAGSGNSKEHFK